MPACRVAFGAARQARSSVPRVLWEGLRVFPAWPGGIGPPLLLRGAWEFRSESLPQQVAGGSLYCSGRGGFMRLQCKAAAGAIMMKEGGRQHAYHGGVLIIEAICGFPDACSLKNIVIEHMFDWNVSMPSRAQSAGSRAQGPGRGSRAGSSAGSQCRDPGRVQGGGSRAGGSRAGIQCEVTIFNPLAASCWALNQAVGIDHKSHTTDPHNCLPRLGSGEGPDHG